MRILLVSDLHYARPQFALPQFDWVVDNTAGSDLVVLAGDHLDIASAAPLKAQVAVIDALVGHVGDAGRLVLSSGNHDLTGPDVAGGQGQAAAGRGPSPARCGGGPTRWWPDAVVARRGGGPTR